MVERNGLRVFKHEFNDINGGSSRYYICHKISKYKIHKSVNKVLKLEKKYEIEKRNPAKFFHKIKNVLNYLV